MDFFLEQKIDLNLRDKSGTTGFLYACSVNNLALCEKLMANKVDVTLMNKDQNTALHFLVRNSNSETERYLALLKSVIAAGVDINSKNYRGDTPLMFACQQGNILAVKFLLDSNADFGTTNL